MDDTSQQVVPLRDPMVHDLHIRVSRIEQESNSSNTQMAVLKNDMAYIKESVNSITRGINKILLAIAFAVVGAATTFVMAGGLIQPL